MEQKEPDQEEVAASAAKPKPKTSPLVIVIAIVVLLLIIGGGIWWWQRISILGKGTPALTKSATSSQKSQPAQKSTTEKKTEIPSAPTLEGIDDIWNQYTNSTLGFSIKIPKTWLEFYGNCVWKEDESDHSWRPEEKTIAIKNFEDGDDVWFASVYFYQLGGESKEEFRTLFSECDKTDTTLDVIKADLDHGPHSTKLTIKTVQNDDELAAAVKDAFGAGCNIEKSEAGGGVYDVTITNGGLDNPDCQINYAFTIKYAPEKNKVLLWPLGQDFVFRNESGGYDQEVLQSFKFE